TFHRGKGSVQIAVQTEPLSLAGNTDEGIFLTASFIVFGRKVVPPSSVELEFISYSAKRKFSLNRTLQIWREKQLVFSGNLRLVTSGTSAEGVVTEILDSKLPYAQFVRLIRHDSSRLVVGDLELELRDANVDALRDLQQMIDSSVAF